MCPPAAQLARVQEIEALGGDITCFESLQFMKMLLTLSVTLLLGSLCVQAQFNQVSYSVKTIATGQGCPSEQQRSTVQSEIRNDVSQLLQNITAPNLGQSLFNPATSCRQIIQNRPVAQSGYYYIRLPNGTVTQFYCDFSANCGSTRGWTRVAFINITDPTVQCPTAFRQITSPIRACGRSTNTSGCDFATLSTSGLQYSRVCGRIHGYQKGQADGFGDSVNNINGDYVDGIGILYGSPRMHIWTFAVGLRKNSPECPCYSGITIPSFVGNNYFCDSGYSGIGLPSVSTYYVSDPVWDGQGCAGATACCTFNNPPWFVRDLPASTSEDIEMAMCSNGNYATNEDSPFDLAEIYVQ